MKDAQDKQAEERKRQADYQQASRQAQAQARQAQRQETEETRKRKQEEFQRREAFKAQLKKKTDEACARYDEELKAGEEEDRKAHELRVEKERRKNGRTRAGVEAGHGRDLCPSAGGGYSSSGKEEPGFEVGADPREGESGSGYDAGSGESDAVESGCCERCFY